MLSFINLMMLPIGAYLSLFGLWFVNWGLEGLPETDYVNRRLFLQLAAVSLFMVLVLMAWGIYRVPAFLSLVQQLHH